MLKRSRPFALVALLVAGALVAALTGAATPLPAGQFALTGHWVFNSVLQVVFHIDGATTNIDAHADVDGEPGSQVVQSDTHGYVVGPSVITKFDKATLATQESISPPANELPVFIEVVGGPYLVYRNAGKVVRLSDPPTIVTVGGAVGTPIVTTDGMMWLHRQDVGQLCTIAKDADRIGGCPVGVPAGHPGALTIVDGKPAFVDTFSGTLHRIDNGKLGEGVPIGVPLSPNARPATNGVGGKLAILDPQKQTLVLADTKNPPEKALAVALPVGDYDGPMSTGDVVVLVDRQSGNVLTYTPDGVRKESKPIKQKGGTPRLSRGEDNRVYVEDADGTQVVVVAKDGNVQDVSTAERPAPPTSQVNAPNPNQGTSTDVRVAAPPPATSRQPQPPRQPTSERPRPPVTPSTPPPVPPGRPGAPPTVTASAGNGSATVNWGTAPNNRADITGYQVSWRASTGQTGSMTVGAGARRTSVNGLTNGVSYTFTVAATNRMGTGPGASAAPVIPRSPVSPAAAPTNPRATFDVDDRPTRDVTVSWGQPALNGGTLVHYQVVATGLGTRQVTGTSVTYSQVQASNVITFTIRAITRTSDGQTLTGSPATTQHRDSQQNPPSGARTVTISQGDASSTDNCHRPNCYWVNTTLSGFAPRTTYSLRLSSEDSTNVVTEQATTDSTGRVQYNKLNYDVIGNRVWVTVLQGNVKSNEIVWRRK
ncbi:fibronectin type III domain-containing protein [Kibdelosporangium aridum]|uniref:Fibronectin type III domain-containing protein n=1 Tax=Kibdelosporangium aridum TaxID=2030 RepID=A0A428ZNR4_KIBAR|nr:fibronectin type III domain-containing protein [Kibdelosporangium aridum]RSM89692.1 fibronectin type III domain-containing protein [Kibdelosporangium aridum]